MKKIIIYSLIGVSLLSCKEKIDHIESVTQDPVFYLKGMADQMPVNIIAGENNYYLYSTNNKDSNDIYQFTSILKQDGCTNCEDEFQIIIKDFKQSTASDIDINAALGLINYQYYSEVLPPAHRMYEFRLDPSTNIPSGYEWDFGDGTTSNEMAPFHVYRTDGNYDVTLKADFDGCTYQLQRNVNIGNAISTYKYDFYYVINGPAYAEFYCIGGDTTGARVLWDFGDGTTSTNYYASHTFSSPIGPDHHVKMEIIPPHTLDTIRITKQLNLPGMCTANFESTQADPPEGYFDFSRVIIKWKDKDGVEYTSETEDQPASSGFSITEVNSYSLNENGEKTKKFLIKFNCDVWGNGIKKELRDMEGVIAVSYP